MPKLAVHLRTSWLCNVSDVPFREVESMLIAHLFIAGPLPRFDGIVVDTTASVPESGTKSPPPGANGPIRVPPLQPDDANKFVSLFEKSDVKNGMISGM